MCVETGTLDFSFSVTIDLNFAGFKLFGTTVSLDSSGLTLLGSIDVVGIFQVEVSGTVNFNLSFALTGSANVSLFGNNASVSATFSKGTGLLDFGLGGSLSVNVLGQKANGTFYVNTSLQFYFSASITVGANLPDLPYPCIKNVCKEVCLPLPCVVGCAVSLYGTCIVPAMGLCTSCKTVCVPLPQICYYSLGWVGCTATIAFSNNGLEDPIGASCSLPLIGTIGVSLSVSCGKICAHFSFFGASVNLCTPCLWSDVRLKTDIVRVAPERFACIGLPEYEWRWNDLAQQQLGLQGSDNGVIAQEVQTAYPTAVVHDPSGFYKVDYGALDRAEASCRATNEGETVR
jgi:hypothetical protein